MDRELEFRRAWAEVTNHASIHQEAPLKLLNHGCGDSILNQGD